MLINNLLDRLKKYKFFSELLTPEAFSQMKRYVITGFTGFAIEYLLFYTFNNFVFKRFFPGGYSFVKGIAESLFNYDLKGYTYSYLLANAIAYVVVFWFNFLVNRIWSFKSKVNIFKQLKQYAVLFIFNLIATSTLLYVLSDKIGIMPELSKILVMGSVVCWNFVIYKKIIYK
ncbi:GtrA family protein [Acetivibrio mesophilus]|uniref:GtrA family protein n=1 Tax=Acetivibrio mesophilus TaxID=2487273 RepID=A0A4Q0I4P9_9FIRM|nr:GtrA family protein [Acetivibrio mesophilus]ODM26993.1 polysaccharide biosynthesis protein GtrA [Clostridium sp. Bc-iso-3]RXE59258.1 GtrA family protein [Acetivibrio mesophilus]HHV29911.1 GtrA family protein [Clostridium sp.]